MRFLSELFGRFGVLEWAGIVLSVVVSIPFVMNALAISRHKREMRKLRWTRIFGNKMLREKDPKECKLLMDCYLDAIRHCKLPERKRRRSEPRRIVCGTKKFPGMCGARKTKYHKVPNA